MSSTMAVEKKYSVFYQESKQFRCIPFLQSPKSLSAIREAGPALLRLQYPKEDLMSATHSGHFSMAYPMVAQVSGRHKKTCHVITHSSSPWCPRQQPIHPWGTLLGAPGRGADLILSPQCLCLDRSLLEVKRDNETDSKYTLEPLGANLGNPGSKVPQLHGAANSTYLISQDAQCLEPSISPHSPPSLAGTRVSPFTYISSGH